MGTEMLVALGALVLAAASGVKLLVVSRRLHQLEFRSAQASQIQNDWQERLEGLEMLESGVTVFEAGHRNFEPHSQEEVSSRQVRQLASTVQVLELRAREHDALLRAVVTEDEALHLWNVSRAEHTIYERHPGVETELRSLVRRGLLKKTHSFRIHELGSTFDLIHYFELTDAGEVLLSLRKHLEAADHRTKDSMPPRRPDHEYDLDSLDLGSPIPELRILPAN